MSKDENITNASEELSEEGQGRRDFIVDTSIGVACVGAAAAAIPFVSSMAPSADVLAVGATEVDLGKIKEGETVTVMWRGNPVFIKHRSKSDIEAAQSVDIKELRDPQKDEERVKKG
jgi:ubiquinol-cytochrome c reductase iron-sulfur subunit